MAPTRFWRDRGFSLWTALVAVAACAFVSFALPYLVGLPGHPWLVSPDAWATTNSAQYVSFGGVGTVYSINPWYSALPGFLLVYAPVTAVADHFGMLPAYPAPLPHPSMWLLSGPFFFVCGATTVPAVDFLAQVLGVSRRRRKWLAPVVAVLVVIPGSVMFGHPEDLLALTLSCVSLGFIIEDRPAGAAVALSLAILMQTWAGLLLPVVVAAAPASERLRTMLRATAVPAAAGVMFLAADWKDASLDLLGQPMPGVGQHLPWYRLAGHVTISNPVFTGQVTAGSTTRWVAVLAALLAAVPVLRRRSAERVMLAAALALYARGLFEVEFWPYYLIPAAVMFAVLGARATAGSTRRYLVVLGGALLLYGSAPMAGLGVQYPALVALLVLLASGGLCVGASFPTWDIGPGPDQPTLRTLVQAG